MTDDGRDSGDDAPDNDLADDEDDLPDPEDVIASSTDDTTPLSQDLPSAADIIAVHERIVEEYDLTHTGTRTAAPQLTLRENVLERVDQYDGVFSRAAGLFRHTVTEHVFEDGNKRTAWITTRQYLDDHGLVPAERDPERVERVAKSIRSYDITEIAAWLEDGTIDEEKLNPR